MSLARFSLRAASAVLLLLAALPLAVAAQVRFGTPVDTGRSRYGADAPGSEPWDIAEAFRQVQEERDDRRDRRDEARRRARERTIECASYNKQRATCPIARHSRSVRLVETLSNKGCNEGRSWGWNDEAVWVDRGCRGLFAVDEGRR